LFIVFGMPKIEDTTKTENEKLPTLDIVLEEMKKRGFGNKFFVTVICDYKTMPHPLLKKDVTVPLATTIEIEFDPRTPVTFKLDFFKRMNETSPIIAFSFQTGSKVQMPKTVEEMIKVLQTPCGNECGGKCESCEQCKGK